MATLATSTTPDNIIAIIAGLNVASFLLGLLIAMLIYKPKLKAMKAYMDDLVKDKMAEKLRGIESLLTRGGRPETKEVRRILIKPDDVHHLYSLLSIQGIIGKYKTWEFLAHNYPETKDGSWEINTDMIMAPVLIQHAEMKQDKPTEQAGAKTGKFDAVEVTHGK